MKVKDNENKYERIFIQYTTSVNIKKNDFRDPCIVRKLIIQSSIQVQVFICFGVPPPPPLSYVDIKKIDHILFRRFTTFHRYAFLERSLDSFFSTYSIIEFKTQSYKTRFTLQALAGNDLFAVPGIAEHKSFVLR